MYTNRLKLSIRCNNVAFASNSISVDSALAISIDCSTTQPLSSHAPQRIIGNVDFEQVGVINDIDDIAVDLSILVSFLSKHDIPNIFDVCLFCNSCSIWPLFHNVRDETVRTIVAGYSMELYLFYFITDSSHSI